MLQKTSLDLNFKNALFTKMNNKLRFLFKKNLKNYIINYKLNFGGNIYVN